VVIAALEVSAVETDRGCNWGLWVDLSEVWP